MSSPAGAAPPERRAARSRPTQPVAPDFEANWKFTGVYRERQIDAALQLYGAMGVERRDMAGRQNAYLRNFACFDAPHAVFVFMPQGFGAREAADTGCGRRR